MIEERYRLATERIRTIASETIIEQPYRGYFSKINAFLIELLDWYEQENEKNQAAANAAMYHDILPEQYGGSYANPTYACEKLGEEYGAILSALYVELRSLITSCHERNLEDLVIHMELWIEVYCLFVYAKEELDTIPPASQVVDVIGMFVQDYCEMQYEQRMRAQFDPTNQFAVSIIRKEDLTNTNYLYLFGEYITEYEIRLSEYLANLPQETICKMADTFTEGYRIGFVLGKKDLSKKKVANIRYVLGFERVVKQAIENFAAMGLDVTIQRTGNNFFHRKGVRKTGYYGAIPNRQYEYDHREDDGLFLTKQLCNRKLESARNALEQVREWTEVHAGPAVLEVFGEDPFVPVNKEAALTYSPKQQQIAVEYQGKSAQLLNEYCKPEERSFTIIAFPTPHIGTLFEEIFAETIRLNTLDYKAYERMQQIIIDQLDQGECVRIQGMNGNKTDLQVALWEIEDGNKQTKFENCVADVNIPVGEVFTSPKLQGTNGVLHVTRVYLNGFEYRDLTLEFKDGMVVDYMCSNFATKEESKAYIKETVMARRETLPMGEFAIGTNTTAYVVAKKYKLEDKLPILIAEKTGPHFAIGDTCYSHSEEIAVCNPNGKEVIARENECSLLRHEEASGKEAYFYHHLDITIPYDELGVLEVIGKDGSSISIIQDGRFVLEGIEALNEPFDS